MLLWTLRRVKHCWSEGLSHGVSIVKEWSKESCCLEFANFADETASFCLGIDADFEHHAIIRLIFLKIFWKIF